MPTYTDSSNYGYTPTAAWCIVFVVLFSVSAIVHCIQAWRSKYWIIYPTLVLGAVIEIMGWAGRLWSSYNVYRLDPFLMQISLLIMAPVFFSAYCYAVLGTAIHKLGQEYSFLRPNWYFIVFITADIISLILQAVGGGQAASSAADSAPTQSATNIMVAGIIFQLVTMGIFIGCGVDFCIRAQLGRPYKFQLRRMERQAAQRTEKTRQEGQGAGRIERNGSGDSGASTVIGDAEAAEKRMENFTSMKHREHLGRWWLMMLGVAIASAMIFLRGIYRSIELVEGWSGFLMTHEIYQNVLDGIPMVIAVAVFNVFNPGYLLPKKVKWGSYY